MRRRWELRGGERRCRGFKESRAKGNVSAGQGELMEENECLYEEDNKGR